MQEVQVNAIGASAEFHDFQGGVVNIVTKSGSNSYRGAGSFYIIPPGLVGNNTPAEQFPYKIHYNQQATFELGGPIKKDRAWFYGILPTSRQLTTGVGVDPNLDKQGGRNYKPFAKNGALLFERQPQRRLTTTCSAVRDRQRTRSHHTKVEHGHNPVTSRTRG
jgi:hypothetical protein